MSVRLRGCAWLIALLFVILAVSWNIAFAMVAPHVGTQYARRVWRVPDGLPEETVQALAQTRDGYLWVGTTGGLARFDGSHFHLFTRDTTVPLGNNSIFCILKARDGSLWLGTEGSGLVHMGLQGYRVYASADGLSDQFVRALMQDHAGRIWVGTDNGLFRIEDGILRRVNTAPLAPALAVHSIMEDRENRVWVGGSQLLVFQKGGMRLVHLPGQDSVNRIKSLLQTGDGTVWAGTVGGIDRMTGGRFVQVPQISGTVRCLYQTLDGTLWIGTIGHGLWRYADGAFNRFDQGGLLPSKTVLSVFEDDARQIWVGTQEGLVRLSKTPVSLFPLPGGSDPDYTTISASADGAIWVVSTHVFIIRDGVVRSYSFPQLARTPVRSVFRARDGSLWIGTDGDGVYHLSGKAVRHYAAPAMLSNNFVRVFLEARDGTIWVGMDDGLSHISQGSVRNYGVRDGLAYFSTRALLQDRNGDLWIGTEKGVSHMHDGIFIQDAVTKALEQEKVWSILQDTTGALWFGTRNHGLFHYAQGRMVQYTTAQGLSSNSIYQLIEHRGSLWISSPNTISSFRLSQVGDPVVAQQLAVQTYQMPYNAEGASLYGGRQPSGCLGADGSIWFPSSKGALRLKPDPEIHFAPPRKILLSATVDGRPLPVQQHPLLLSASASRLEVGFTPLMLRTQQGLRFRYKLKGFDRDWTYTSTDRTVSYTNLAAGKYQFIVQAFEINDPAAVSEAILPLVKRPYFYETWWFAAAGLMMFSFLVWALYQSRVRSLRLRFKAVLEERGRIAREMHDTVIQGCTSISALLEGISSLQNENISLQHDLIEHARTQVRSTIHEARQAVWNLRHKDDFVPDIGRSIAAIAQNTARELGVPVHCKEDGRVFAIPGPPARELLMVVREAIYNAAIHGAPRQIEVSMAFTTASIAVAVSDDGVGFLPASLEPDNLHYGVAGMRERIEQMGGQLDITSRPQQGTVVSFTVERSHLQSAAQTDTI
jgi:ligand-binding sensor domain-containing protein/signal transduction histidine kinase